MQRLILMRHGEAERPHPGLEDFDRALDEEGRAESRRMGKALSEAGLQPDLALVSAARRTLETWATTAAGALVETPQHLGRQLEQRRA